ncbi:tetratricopeptide repeat protein [Kangiella sp. HD9-110m-PIT-SAG07]|nr:tetratricopeptide repeat protein [Kangiella sp. HD9-110m-PIT-SAG07]
MMKYIILTTALFFIQVGPANAGYFEKLRNIESQRVNDLAATRQALKDLSIYQKDFTQIETHLYWLLWAHSELMNSNYSEAEKFLLGIIDSGASADYKGRAHSILAAGFHLQGQYYESYIHFDKALAMIPKMNDKEYKANILQNAVSFYNDSGLVAYAMDYASRLLKYSIENNDKSKQCHAYFDILNIEISAKKYDLADDRLMVAYKTCRKAKNELFLLHLKNLESDIAISRGKLSKAKQLLENNYKEVKTYGWATLISLTEIRLANLYFEVGQYNDSEKVAIKAFEASSKTGDTKRSKNAAEVLAKTYSKLNDKDKAIKYYQLYVKLEQKMNAISHKRKQAYDNAKQVLRAKN